ncbi:MAG: PEP-utilizing enzyme [Acidimicrobiia bacterium]|nr:PEP-utilizing enzyme [Acidimicrobiia bacterium]
MTGLLSPSLPRAWGYGQMVDKWLVETDLNEDWNFYTRANVGEVFPDPVAPLTFGWVQDDAGIHAFERGFRGAYYRYGCLSPEEFPPDRATILATFGGYTYLNASAMRMIGHRAEGMSAQTVDDVFFGDAPGVPEFVEKPEYDRPDLTAKTGETMVWAITASELPEVARHEAFVNSLRHDRPDIAGASNRRLVEHAMGLMNEHLEMLFEEHIFISAVATIPIGAITQICAAVGRPEATLRLLGGLGDVESAAPSLVMWELGRVVATSDALATLFDAGVAGLDARIRSSASEDAAAFAAAFDDFLVHYGSRGPNEWELRCPTWETDPDLALAAIDRMRLADDSASPIVQNSESAAERERLGVEIAAMLEGDPGTQGVFLGALQAATVFLPGRERTKTNCVKLIEEARVALHEYGRRRVADGHFPELNSFGLLSHAELFDSLDHPERYGEILVERHALYEEVAMLQEPFIVHGVVPDMAAYPRRDEVEYRTLAAGDVIQGMPGCPGSAVGTARVILDTHDPTSLEPGDILIAPITDPSWTPLFVPAAAIVVDVGAALSHAIIVSRELGNPCVVSATDATHRIPDGATVEVNGDTGTVTVLAVP